MKDLKAPLLIAVPAAITILGIVWFLRKVSGGDKDGKRTSSKSGPSVDKASLKKGDKQTQGSPSCMEKEGITLTQRKIPETTEKVAGSSSKACDSLTEGEREKVREIVDAAIGAGLKEAKSEAAKAACVEGKFMEVEEEMTAASVASVECRMNNNSSVGMSPSIESCNKARNEENNSFLSQGNYIDNKAISDFFTNDQTTLDRGESSTVSSNVPKHHSSSLEISSSSANVVSSSPSPLLSSSHAENDISQQLSSNTVPSEPISTTKRPEMDGLAPSTPADTNNTSLSPSALPSDKSDMSKDSVIDDSSIASDITPKNALVSSHDNLPSSSSVQPSPNMEGSSKAGQESSSEQVIKAEESSSSSSNNSTSPVCDNNSVGSSDSGRGGSEQDMACQNADSLIHFDFNMPSELCGRLIGKKGYNINQLKTKSGASVSLTHNPLSAEFQICQVVGTQAEIDEALRLIRQKFPLEDNPRLTMAPLALTLPKQIDSTAPVIVPDNMQLSLPDGASVEVYVSTIVDSGHVFVQQPTHRSFMALEKLNFFLNTVYGQDDSIPSLPLPIECGVICVCENEGSWYRAMVMTPEDECGECQVKFVDYGGYTQLPTSCIKQIRADFMSLPFQAVECFVANIAPLQGEEYFSTESTMALSEMSQMKLLQCQVVARNEIGTPYIHLYVVNPENNTATMLNRALVNNGLVRWVEIL